MVDGATKVANNPLCSDELRFSWSVHVKSHLLDCVIDVRPSEGDVLESPDKVLVRHHITDWGIIIIKDLRLGVDGRVTRLAIEHARLLSPVKKEALWATLHARPLGSGEGPGPSSQTITTWRRSCAGEGRDSTP